MVKNPTKLAKRCAKKLNRDGKRMERTIERSMLKEAIGHVMVVDGIEIEEGERMLFTNNPDPRKNGIWRARVGRWERP